MDLIHFQNPLPIFQIYPRNDRGRDLISVWQVPAFDDCRYRLLLCAKNYPEASIGNSGKEILTP